MFMLNFENDAMPIRLTHPVPVDHDSITDFREHDASNP